MQKRQLGRSGLEVAPLALGGNVFGWTADDATSFAILDAFVARGFALVDTADMYSTWVPGHLGGDSEAVIGRWIAKRGRRDDVVIATKVGMQMGDGSKGLSKAHIVRSVEASLTRLNTDYIDLYQSHVDDAEVALDETLAAHAQLVRDGKVRAIGASNHTGDRLLQALAVSREHGLPRYETLQPLYNMLERTDFETNLAPVCLAEGLGVLPYFSLASGFLTGKYRSEADLGKSPRGAWVAKYLDARGHRVLAALDAAATKHGATPSQIALAWLMAKPAVTAPIASASTLPQLEEIMGAVDVALDAGDVAGLDEASAG
jgi:aryl-alcohol dehydrogenase-like predicted oxidoreductase